MDIAHTDALTGAQSKVGQPAVIAVPGQTVSTNVSKSAGVVPAGGMTATVIPEAVVSA